MHEDVDLTNYTLRPVAFHLTLEVDADFADLHETGEQPRPDERLERSWREEDGDAAQLTFDYHAQHAYSHQGESGVARLHRGLAIRISNSGSRPMKRSSGVEFSIRLNPGEQWHACLDLVPHLDGVAMKPKYRCR